MSALTVSEQAIRLFAGIGVTLLVASVIGYVLKVGVAQSRPHGVIDNLNARIRSWWVIVSVVGVAFVLGRDGMTLLFVFVSFMALREFTAPISSRRGDPLLSASFLIVLPVQYLLVRLGWFSLYSTFVPVCAFVLVPVVAAATSNTRRFAECATTVQWGLMICVFCLSHVPAILTLDIAGYEGRNLLLIVFLMVVVQSSDVLQYVWGKLCGRRKVAPTISASKTWEGLVGGVASATGLGAALFWITPFTPLEAALMALAVNAMGVLGGFVMSAIKRSRGIKDWGSLIEGHGGMLDRLDSMVFAAPVFFHLTRGGWS
jgi:phosphatidate cytidylyltransferase